MSCCTPQGQGPSGIRSGALPSPAALRDRPVIKGLVPIPAQTFQFGCDGPGVIAADGEGPARPASVDEFTIGTTTVTRAAFAEFAWDTGYRTTAEERGSSFVFHACLTRPGAFPSPDDTPWWCDVPGACWHSPHGPGSDNVVPMDHPVTHVSWFDAIAYCRWSGTRLPAEEEWECAARGGRPGTLYPWGDRAPAEDGSDCTIFAGEFPEPHQRPYLGTTRAGALAPNGYGLHQVVGNVWEWCLRPASDRGQDRTDLRPIRGGSHLCHQSYCARYRVSSRLVVEAGSTTGHIGFRVAV